MMMMVKEKEEVEEEGKRGQHNKAAEKKKFSVVFLLLCSKKIYTKERTRCIIFFLIHISSFLNIRSTEHRALCIPTTGERYTSLIAFFC